MEVRVNLKSFANCIKNMKVAEFGLDGLKRMHGKILDVNLRNNEEVHITVDTSSSLNNYKGEIREIQLSKLNSNMIKLEKIEEFKYMPENRTHVDFIIKTNYSNIYEFMC